MEIRAVSDRDFAAWSGLWADYLRFYGTSRPPAVHAAAWKRILDPETAMHAALAIRDGAAVGLVNFLYHKSFWDVRDRCYLNDLFVAPAARGTGIGAALIGHVRDHAADRDAEEVYWLTAQDNATARRLYDRVADLTPFIKYRLT